MFRVNKPKIYGFIAYGYLENIIYVLQISIKSKEISLLK